MDKYERQLRDFRELTADERRAMMAALQQSVRLKDQSEAMTAAVLQIAQASARGRRRQASDRQSDARRRLLVGARVPREMAERCKAAAEAQGVSLYRWIVNALLAALEAA